MDLGERNEVAGGLGRRGSGDAPTIVGFGETYGSIDLKLHPLGAYRLLGFPLSELTGACVSLPDVFGPAGARLAERLQGLTGWDERFDVLERFLLVRVAAGPSADPAVAWAWRRLERTFRPGARRDAGGRAGGQPPLPIEALRRAGWAVAKPVARLLRFADVRRRIERAPSTWAQIAFEAGYADQSHLNREFQQLAGTTPTDFAARLIPGGGVVGDGVTAAV